MDERTTNERDTPPHGRRRSSVERFPTTRATRLGAMLREGPFGVREAGRYVMEVYAEPLKAYFQGSSFRTLGDPDEVIEAFFADRLARETFLESWARSGHRFRYWLLRAFRNFLLEQLRAKKRWQRGPEVAARAAPPAGARNGHLRPEAIFHREATLSMVRDGIERTERECRDLGLHEHWTAFVRHHLDGADFRTVGAELGVGAARAAVMARTAASRFRATMRAAVAWKGAGEREVEEEIAALMEALET